MVELCRHHTVNGIDIEDNVRIIKDMSLEKLEHIVRCVAQKDGLIYGVAKLIAERTLTDYTKGRLPPYTKEDINRHNIATFKRLGVGYPQSWDVLIG